MMKLLFNILAITLAILTFNVYADVSASDASAGKSQINEVQSKNKNTVPSSVSAAEKPILDASTNEEGILRTETPNELGGSEYQNNQIKQYLGIDY